MRSLHVACLPFPSSQGTQALIEAQASTLADAGDEVHVLTYESGDGRVLSPTYTLHRCGGEDVTLRSGPSLGKVRGDLAMVRALRRLVRSVQPDVVFAHNVEAAMVSRLAALRSVPTVYFAHTRMDAELPTYFERGQRVLRTAGWGLDALSSRADHVAAVSPSLAEHFDATYVPPPWRLPDPITAEERRQARHALALEGRVAIYAGNLDGYQDWTQILAARDHGMTLVVATESDPAPLRSFGIDHVLPLSTEADRRRVHALADVALVPRGAPGGLPIKLIDALARGVPVVACERALAGLRPSGVVAASTLDEALRAYDVAGTPTGDGRAWVAEHANAAKFVAAMHRAAGIAGDKNTRSVKRP